MEEKKGFFRNIYKGLLCDKGSVDISKTKAGIWLSVLCTILFKKQVIDLDTFQILIAIASGVAGIGLRDLRKK